MIQWLFVFISVIGLLTALGTVLARNLVHAALFLVAFFFVVACQFVLLEAEFLAAIQVLVYIGAVAILLMFGIMLTRNVQGDDTTTVSTRVAVPAMVATLGLFFVLAFGIDKHGVHRKEVITSAGTMTETSVDKNAWSRLTHRPKASDPVRPGANMPTRTESIDDMARVVGREMVNRYAVPFEVAGLLLTAALVGAVALAHRDVEEETAGRGIGAKSRPASTSDSPVDLNLTLASEPAPTAPVHDV